jgi:hypothetical protein
VDDARSEVGACDMSMRRLNEPVPAQVTPDADGRPRVVEWNGRPGITPLGASGPGVARARARTRAARARSGPRRDVVAHVLDTWYVDDRWWTDAPVRRIYHECQFESGTRMVVVWDLVTRAWVVQR